MELASTLDICEPIEVFKQAVAIYGSPEIINSDQDCQYTSQIWHEAVKKARTRINMAGVGSCRLIAHNICAMASLDGYPDTKTSAAIPVSIGKYRWDTTKKLIKLNPDEEKSIYVLILLSICLLLHIFVKH